MLWRTSCSCWPRWKRIKWFISLHILDKCKGEEVLRLAFGDAFFPAATREFTPSDPQEPVSYPTGGVRFKPFCPPSLGSLLQQPRPWMQISPLSPTLIGFCFGSYSIKRILSYINT